MPQKKRRGHRRKDSGNESDSTSSEQSIPNEKVHSGLTPLARPSLGIRALPSSKIDPANLFGFGEMYMTDLSSLRQFEIVNLQPFPVRVEMNVEIRKPFHASTWGFQTHNENLPVEDSVNEAPMMRSMSKSSFSSSIADTVYVDDGFNELFNQMGLLTSIVLQPNQSQRIIFSICVKYEATSNGANAKQSTGLSSKANAGDDSSDEEQLYVNESSFAALSGCLIFSSTALAPSPTAGSLDAITVPLQGHVCRSLLGLDVKELHFDDCVPGGSYVKDFTVWNRSEIPLVFRMVPPILDDQSQILTCSDYNSGYPLGENPMQVAAYGHMRVRVTYRPLEVGEQSFDILVQNLHDSRNVKTLKVHAVASKEHHREGLSIREPNGSFLLSGSIMDFGDCYTGIPTPKIVLIKNMTEAPLHIELSSDRPKEITFELKLAGNNRARSSRSMSTMRGFGYEEPLSPTDSRLSLSPSASSPTSGSIFKAENGDSDEEPDENDVEDEDSSFSRKRNSFEETIMSEIEDADDDMEFDGERVLPPSSPSSPKIDETPGKIQARVRSSRKLIRSHSRIKEISESGVESGTSICSSPERKSMSLTRQKSISSTRLMVDDHVNNYLVEALDLAPGVERTVIVWYCPTPSDVFDVKSCRLTKQSFRLSFRCYHVQGAWTGTNQRVYDRSLGKSLHARSRTCTSYVTMTPSVLNLGDCNIGELRSSSCTLTNHSDLPAVVKPSVFSKVVSTVPNDEMTLGPKQSIEMKIEIIPRKVNANYSRVISLINHKNKLNQAQVCVRSSNMDAHHVIYHSLFYKLHTPSKSAFLNFEHVAANSMSIKVFTLENITNAVLRLRVQSSDPSRVQLYYVAEFNKSPFELLTSSSPAIAPLAEVPMASPPPMALPSAAAVLNITKTPAIRRRRSIGSIKELSAPKTKEVSRLQELLNRKSTAKKTTAEPAPSTVISNGAASSNQPPSLSRATSDRPASFGSKMTLDAMTNEVVNMFESIPRYDPDREKETVALIRERVRRFNSLVADKHILPVLTTKEWNIRVPAKGFFPILAVFSPKVGDETPEKSRVEKYRVYVTLPAGGNKQGRHPDNPSTSLLLSHSLHPFDSRPSVRELLLKSRVCRSVLQVNQKNINFGRITTFSKSTKKVLIRNASAIPLFYTTEKTGSISSGFLEIKEGEQGVIKPFGARHVSFEFQPSLAGPFEEKLKIVNIQDVENSVYVTIKAKVVKRETFKLPQAGQSINVGTCLVGEKSEPFKLIIRNMSRKKREYVVEVDTTCGFSVPYLRPTFIFTMDDIPATNITQAQEKKLEEEVEKLEHKLRIAVTKKKEDKIRKLEMKILNLKALLNGEAETTKKDEAPTPTRSISAPSFAHLASYDSGNSDTESESESRSLSQRRNLTKKPSIQTATVVNNILHFTLDPESTGRIVGHVTFDQIGDFLPAKKLGQNRSRHRRHSRHRSGQLLPPTTAGPATPAFGTGKFLIYEQQNKDVMKELQYKAEVFLRNPAGEQTYCRIMGKALLPPVPFRDFSPLPTPTKPQSSVDRFSVELKPNQLGSTRSSNLLIPYEEPPCDSHGWSVQVRPKENAIIDVKWVPTEAFQDVILLSCEVYPPDALMTNTANDSTVRSDSPTRLHTLPLKLSLVSDHLVNVHLKWHFSSKAGYSASTPLAFCLGKLPMHPEWKKKGEYPVGKILLQDHSTTSTIDVTIVKSLQRSLQLETDRIDLGEQQLGALVEGQFYIRNVSSVPIKFLVLVSSTSAQQEETPSSLVIANATGRVEALGRATIRFTYKGTLSGKHAEHILVRNLNDRLDSTTLTISVRVTRPVYVRIPELDPNFSGVLTDLNFGVCYVTADDMDNKFSKVRKLTLVSQVAETLLLCASSNLKTQCYVYQDASLQHEATNIVLPGMESTDLYIAVRPRLPADAFKTGAARDLMGGIRIQLFREKDHEERVLAAEFTVKFVGVAGASLAAVSPRELDFGTELNIGRLQRCKTHEGRFELTNLNKMLPLQYRVYVASVTDTGYSDDDDSLHVALRHEKGEMGPGESAEIDFGVVAFTHGFFRRRIVVENVHNPQNVNYVDVVLFVDNGSIGVRAIDDLIGLEQVLVDTLQSNVRAGHNAALAFGNIPVISSEPLGLQTSIDNCRRYRIFQPSCTRRFISLVNRLSRPIMLRPISDLPLLFSWVTDVDEIVLDESTFAMAIHPTDARELNAGDITTVERSSLYLGGAFTIEPQSLVVVCVQFAPVACTKFLPADMIEAGRSISLKGMVAFQSFEDHHEQCEATTLGVLPVSGIYGESKLRVLTSVISLGKIGYSTAWSQCTFEVDLKNESDIATVFHLGALPDCLVLLEMDQAVKIDRESNPLPSNRIASLKEMISDRLEKVSDAFYEIQANAAAKLTFQCLHTPEYLPAGRHELKFSIYNLNNPHNTETVMVQAHVIANYMDISLEPDCMCEPCTDLIAYVPPIVVPSESYSGFLFTIGNVFDEDLEVKVTCSVNELFASALEFVAVSRSSNTPISAITLQPGEHVDLRVSCGIISGASWSDLPFASSNGQSRFHEASDLGVVKILATAPHAASRVREVTIKGALVLGQSFTVSATQLRFHANPVPNTDKDYYQLQQSSDCFWIHNPSKVETVNYTISSTATLVPGICFLQKEPSVAAIGDVLCPTVFPESGSIPPKGSVKVVVQLNECDSCDQDKVTTPMQLYISDSKSTATIDVLLVMEDTEMSSVSPALIQSAVSKRSQLPRFRLPDTIDENLSLELTSPLIADSTPSSKLRATESDENRENSTALATPPLLTVRGCTPAENSTLDNTLYVIDVGQHTVRSGAEVEWEITLHNEHHVKSTDSVEYRLYLADSKAKSWLRLSRSHGTLLSYQTIVLHFLRDVVGVYSTFLVLENVNNPADLKLIRVKMEVIADLNALRAMSKDKNITNLFRVLVSNYSGSKRHRRKSSEYMSLDAADPTILTPVSTRLEIEYGDVFYDKLYHNHSLVLENFSGLSLDFMLSSNGRPHEVGFSMSPTSFNEISSVTLGAYQRLQVFLNFRPAPKYESNTMKSLAATTTSARESWVRNIEVYINCRLVKDFRETVFLKAICNTPQLHAHIALAQPTIEDWHTYHEPALPYFPAQPTFLGMGFTAPESILCDDVPTDASADAKFIVLRNVRSDANAHIAIRNDSMFFDVNVDHIVSDDVVLESMENRIDGENKSTLFVKLEPQDIAVLRIQPNLELLRKNRTQWEHSVKEHIAFYNMKQFAEHYHVSLSFTPSSMSSFLTTPQIREAYPFSTLEDTIAKFLKNFQLFWNNLHSILMDEGMDDDDRRSLLYELEHAIDMIVPVSPRMHSQYGAASQATISQSYRALYFDFYYITDELIWYGVRSNAGRHTVTLADLVYSVVFGHEVFACIFDSTAPTANGEPALHFPMLHKNQLERFMDIRRLLLPWTRQLGFFLSFFPENQETTLPLRQLYEPLKRTDLLR